LPLTKGQKDPVKEEEDTKTPPRRLEAAQEDETNESKVTEGKADLKEEPSKVPEKPAEKKTELQEKPHQELNNRLQAIRDGNLTVFSVTVRGDIIDRNYDIMNGVGQDGNQFFCEICKGFGNVVCCDGCPKVYHAACISPEDPARIALDNDDDPWFCATCRERGVSTRLESRKGSAGKSPSPVAAPSAAAISTSSRPERRTMKRKCNECQKSGGEMTPCEGCGVYIHNPRCKADDDSNDDMAHLCSNCRVEAVVEQEEDDREMEEEETSANQVPRPSPDDKAGRRLRKRSIGDEDHDLEEELSSEEMSQAEEEEEDDVDDKEVDADNEATPDKKKRKRASSLSGDPQSKFQARNARKRRTTRKRRRKRRSGKFKRRKRAASQLISKINSLPREEVSLAEVSSRPLQLSSSF
jgi:hypothetical protein